MRIHHQRRANTVFNLFARSIEPSDFPIFPDSDDERNKY